LWLGVLPCKDKFKNIGEIVKHAVLIEMKNNILIKRKCRRETIGYKSNSGRRGEE